MINRLDACPLQPGPASNGGCPVEQKQLVVLKQEKIEIRDAVFFDTGKATIQSKSLPLLDAVAKVIAAHQELKLVRIEGHTDNQGSPGTNRKLSKARAEAVRRYLIEHGVAEERLEAKGLGPDKPIAPNKTPTGRATNRRVEFTVVQPDAEPPPLPEVRSVKEPQ